MSFNQFLTRSPSKIFESYISFYFQQKISGNKQDNPLLYKQTTLPSGCIFLGFNFSNAIEIKSCNQSALLIDYPIYFTGQQNSLYTMELPQNTNLFGVVLHPATASWLTNIPIYELRNSAIEADYHLSKDLRELHDKMANVTLDSRIKLFEQWFTTKIGCAKRDAVFTDWVVEEIIKNRGIISTNILAKTLKVSERHLQRSFKERIGLQPYKYANIVRINNLVNDFNKSDVRLIDLVYDYNYHDKAHFRKQFRKITNTSLASYLDVQNKAATSFLNKITV
ncbi:helix-turn-helix domain-containing protein [Flavivirga abyssicola]|uniref:helix-turn-helix domain-containing protein n=1 Tax=Flavivirga abyssicola TaxID=3063533 RepID=UPI0026DF158F|nr:helix-turn-helix domain-containing protein [Flavivirga sp. MEBiC07777]WVK11691.1 helix-turn-helix domain-containing protein [Flavivirga sp. MEBiC07777]